MASMISKRPVAGIAAGIFFGALGVLIIQTESSTGMIKGFPRLFSGIVAYLLLCVAALSILFSIVSILRSSASQKEQGDPVDSTKAGQ